MVIEGKPFNHFNENRNLYSTTEDLKGYKPCKSFCLVRMILSEFFLVLDLCNLFFGTLNDTELFVERLVGIC